MGRVRKSELPWTRIDDLHKEAFEMLLQKRGLKHPGEEGAWEFTHLWHKLRPWPDSVEGIGMMKKKFVVATLSNGNVALLINMAKNGGIPWDHCFSGETFHHYKPDPEAYLGVVDSMYLKPEQVMLVAAHNNDLAAAQKCGLSTGFVLRPGEHGPEPEARPQGRGRLERRRHVDDRSREEAWVLSLVTSPVKRGRWPQAGGGRPQSEAFIRLLSPPQPSPRMTGEEYEC